MSRWYQAVVFRWCRWWLGDVTQLLSGWPQKSSSFIFTTKMIFPKTLKFMNSGSQCTDVQWRRSGISWRSSSVPAASKKKARGHVLLGCCCFRKGRISQKAVILFGGYPNVCVFVGQVITQKWLKIKSQCPPESSREDYPSLSGSCLPSDPCLPFA